MQTEIEAKFLRVDVPVVVEKLREIGAEEITPKRVLKRKNFDYADRRLHSDYAWVRLREDNGVVRLAYKRQDSAGIDGVKEVEMAVEGFEVAEELLKALGLNAYNYQETTRCSWQIGETLIEIDEWPWCHPLVEIEGPSESAVKSVAEMLGFTWANARFGGADVQYLDEYDIEESMFHDVDYMIFDTEPPSDWVRRDTIDHI